ncbi:MAG: MotA/TolQ/ExbB proton channel family protein [Pirellulaceae bacterium]
MWTLIFLAFAQADDILADEAKSKNPAAAKVTEPGAVSPRESNKSGEPTGVKSPDGKIPEPPKAGERKESPPTETAPADAGGKEGDAAVKEESIWSKMANTGAMGYMIQGGIFMWPILILGILALGVIIERYRALLMINARNETLREKVLELLQQDRIEEALAACEREQGPVPAILGAGLRKYLILRKLNYDPGKIEEQVLKGMEDYSVHVVAALERHIPILATVSSAAPMIGFLGTVQGMVISFEEIAAKSGQGDIVQLAAAGIMVALLTTVLGLIVGIPAYIAFNYFTSVINRFVLGVEETAAELIEAVTLQLALSGREA